MQFIIIFISRDTTPETDVSSRVFFILYAQFRYQSYFGVDECNKKFRQEVLSAFLEPRTLDMVVPLTDGEILLFYSCLSSLIQYYNESEYADRKCLFYKILSIRVVESDDSFLHVGPITITTNVVSSEKTDDKGIVVCMNECYW